MKYIFRYNSPFPLAAGVPDGENNHNNSFNNDALHIISDIIHDVQLTRSVSGHEVLYDLELKIFEIKSKTEEEVIREACKAIIRDADNRYQQDQMMAYNQRSNQRVNHFHLRKRVYRCLTKRQSDDQMYCVMGEFPPISNRF